MRISDWSSDVCSSDLATGTSISPADLVDFAVKEIGSPFARWRHSFLAERPIDMLKALGLVPRFRAIPPSAAALVKTGLGWMSQSRSDGYLIEGKTECRSEERRVGKACVCTFKN